MVAWRRRPEPGGAQERMPFRSNQFNCRATQAPGTTPATLLGVTVLGYEDQLVEIDAQVERSDSKGK